MSRKKMTLNVGNGIATVMMVFFVLSMVIVSLISYLEAVRNYRSADRETEYTQSYYGAYDKAMYSLVQSEDDMIITEELINNSKLVMVRKDGVIEYHITEE